jgi:KDO2-lipid IV(A) lauroyltransferase
MADVLETFIKKHPAEWLWFQHLFWTEPDKIEMLKELKREIP